MLTPELDGSYCLSFLLFPGYSMASLQAAIEPLRLANEITNQPLYTWQLLSLCNKEVIASNGLTISTTDYRNYQPNNLFIHSGACPWFYSDSALLWWLRGLYKNNAVLAGIDTGSYLLAQANLLTKGTVSINWQAAAGFNKQYPQLKISESAYEISVQCISCIGGFAVSELMLKLIKQHFDPTLVDSIASHLMMPEQQIDLSKTQIIKRHEPRLFKVLELMQDNLSEPLCRIELASRAHVSVRQLERLFKIHLDMSPANYYLKIRLDYAQQLILNSPLHIGEISTACGFNSSSNFSRTYRKLFGVGPKRDRMKSLEPVKAI